MKNTSVVWELIIIVLLMCTGVANAVSLLPKNSRDMDYRYVDKSIMTIEGNIEFVEDINISSTTARTEFGIITTSPEYTGFEPIITAPDIWDSTMSVEDMIAMMCIQDDTCPKSQYGDIRVKIGSNVFTITDKWSAQLESNLIKARGELNALFNKDSLRYYLLWNKEEKYWEFFKKDYEYVYQVTPYEGWVWKAVD